VGRTGASLPQQEVQPIRPEYPLPEPVNPPHTQTPQGANRAGNQAAQQNRPSRRRRRRGRGGAPQAGTHLPAPAVAGAPPATSAEHLPEAAEPAPVSAPAAPEPATRFAPEITPPAQAPATSSKPSKGVVVLAIGLPGSGKSTWFKRRGVTPLSSDLLRAALFDDITEQRYQHLVFSTLRSILRARLIARMPWNYLDATNLSPKERRHWIQMARQFGYEVHAVFFDVPLEVCLERNRRRQRMVPEDVMRNMAAKLRPPKFEEGFARITVVRVKQD